MPLGHAHALTYPKTFARAAIAANGTKLYVRVGGLGARGDRRRVVRTSVRREPGDEARFGIFPLIQLEAMVMDEKSRRAPTVTLAY
jgi:hypothetical protein